MNADIQHFSSSPLSGLFDFKYREVTGSIKALI